MSKIESRFEIESRVVKTSVGYVTVEKIKKDPGETGHRRRYQAVEILTYIFTGLLAWPYLKGQYGIYKNVIKKKAKEWLKKRDEIKGKRFFFDIVKCFKEKINPASDPRHEIKSSSILFDGIMVIGSWPLKQIRKFAALAKSLDMIYNYPFNKSVGRFGILPAGLEVDWWKKISPIGFVNRIVKVVTDFWIGMPVAQDVRTRPQVVIDEIKRLIFKKHDDGAEIVRIAVLAGGTQQDIINAIAEVVKKRPLIQLEVLCIEPDGRFSLKRSKELIETFHIPAEIFQNICKRTSVDSEKLKRDPKRYKTLAGWIQAEGYKFSDFDLVDLVVCIGLGDYQFGEEKLIKFIKMLDNGRCSIITANVSGNLIERPFLHVMIQWPWMQYLSLRKYIKVLQRALTLNSREIRIIQTPHGIFNIAVIE